MRLWATTAFRVASRRRKQIAEFERRFHVVARVIDDTPAARRQVSEYVRGRLILMHAGYFEEHASLNNCWVVVTELSSPRAKDRLKHWLFRRGWWHQPVVTEYDVKFWTSLHSIILPVRLVKPDFERRVVATFSLEMAGMLRFCELLCRVNLTVGPRKGSLK